MKPKVYSELKQCYETPNYLLDFVRRIGPIGLDPCTAKDNPTGARLFFSSLNPASDPNKWPAIFDEELCFVNNPYCDNKTWLDCILQYARPTVALWNASVGTPWFNKALNNAQAIVFWEKRVSFINPTTKKPVNGSPFGSVLFFFNLTTEQKGILNLIKKVAHCKKEVDIKVVWL